MATPNPRPRGGASLSDTLRAGKDDRQQIRRLLSTQAKPKAAASGGVTGITRLTAGSIVQTNDVAPVGSSVTFADFSSSTTGEAVSVTESATEGRFDFGVAGFYQAHAYVRLAWDSADTVDEVRASADWSGADPFPLWFRRLGSADGIGGAPSLRDSFTWGPFYVEAGGWTSFGLNWMTNENCFLSAMAIDFWRVG